MNSIVSAAAIASATAIPNQGKSALLPLQADPSDRELLEAGEKFDEAVGRLLEAEAREMEIRDPYLDAIETQATWPENQDDWTREDAASYWAVLCQVQKDTEIGRDMAATIRLIERSYPSDELIRSIENTPTQSLAGLAVKAKVAAFVGRHLWEKPRRDLDLPERSLCSLIDATLRAAGLPSAKEYLGIEPPQDEAEARSAGTPIASSSAGMADLGALARKYEPLLETYYVAHRNWSRTLHQAHVEQDAAFGRPAEQNDYHQKPEIVAAWNERCARTGASEAGHKLHAITLELRPIADAIKALPAHSIEGLRAKALVSFFDVAPLGAGDKEYHFQDEVAFQELFCAVAEFVGLSEKLAATGYRMPPLPVVDDEDGEEDEAA